MRRAALLAVIALAGCHHHRDLNAPRVIDPMAPPKNVADPVMEYPDDPGEKLVMLTTGVLGGVFGGSIDDDGGPVGDFAAEATVSWGENPVSHNDRADRMFMPRGVLLPPRSTGVTLGWSAVRVRSDPVHGAEARVGAVYVEAQKAWLFGGVGAGWAFDPVTRGTGPQVNAFYTFYFVRGRVLFGDGWELGGGMQIKIPNTWVWQR